MRLYFFIYVIVGLLLGCQNEAENTSSSFAKVTLDNVVDIKFIEQAKRVIGLSGGINQLYLIQNSSSLDAQKIPFMNRDLLFGIGLFDISQPVTLTLPDTGKRYISLMPINEQGYTNFVYQGESSYKFTQKEVGSDYMILVIRIYADNNDPIDIENVSSILNNIKITAASTTLLSC